MKTACIFRGIVSLTLLFALGFSGCDSGTNGNGGSTTTYYTVSFDGGDGSGSPPPDREVEANSIITLPAKGSSLTAPAGKDFDGWRTGGQTYAAGDEYTVTRNVTFTAQWKDLLPAGFTVTFAGGEGSGTPPPAQQVTANTSITLPVQGSLTAPANKEFDGWQTPGGQKYAAGAGYTVTGDITFTAQWKAVAAVVYTVTFNSDGGTPASETATSSGGFVTLPAVPLKTGFDFDGWYTEKNGAGTPFTATTLVDRDRTVYANWKAADPLKSGVWIDWQGNEHYKFDGEYYETASVTTFTAKGAYSIDTNRHEITLRPTGGNLVVKSYKITQSLLVFQEGKPDETWYTKNHETEGGFNGTPASSPLDGMWQIDGGLPIDIIGFNKDGSTTYDGEYFEANTQKNRNGKYWWNVVGTYQYNSSRDELRVYYHNSYKNSFQVNSDPIYKAEFGTGNRILDLTNTMTNIKKTYSKQSGL